MVDLIALQENRQSDIVPNELEPLVIEKVLDIALRAGEEIIDRHHLMTLPKQHVTEM
jgi:hypothetical protein